MPYGHHLDLYGIPSIPEQIISLKRLNSQSYIKCTQAIVNSVECQSQISRSLIAQLSIHNFKISSSFPEISLGRTSGYLPHTKYCLKLKAISSFQCSFNSMELTLSKPRFFLHFKPRFFHHNKILTQITSAPSRSCCKDLVPPPPPSPGIKSSVLWYPQVSNPQCFGTPRYKISGCTKSL